MTAAQSFNPSSPFPLKQEKDECSVADDEDEDENDDEDDDDEDDDDEEDENDDNDANSVSSLAQPSILEKDCAGLADPKDEFLRLTSMVRRVYFSYLHKSVISNYNVCHDLTKKEISKFELKKFAGQMELCAVKASLEASLYRQTMLKMISDIKGNTSRNKVHKKLTLFLEAAPNRVDVAVQTNEDVTRDPSITDSSYLAKDVHIQSAFVTSNFDENSIIASDETKKELRKSVDEIVAKNEPKEQQHKNLDERISDLLKTEAKLSKVVEPKRVKPSRETSKIRVKQGKSRGIPIDDDKRRKIPSTALSQAAKTAEVSAVRETPQVENQRMYNDMQEIFGKEDAMVKSNLINEDEGSQDSLMQHLEDMFCESDDSSDLMTLIEKHSGVTKANLDSEIGKMCPEETTQDPPQQPSQRATKSEENLNDNVEKQLENASNKRKLSFSNYKKMKKRAMGEPETPPLEETAEDRQNRKVRDIWFVERVHQVTKLKAKMMELSVKNYRKHGRVRAKFIELFGDTDEEEMMPESPIHIEEHLNACKERIAPWVVKYLMPYYSKKVIRNRLLFKTVAKHIADMLIIENTFPEEECVCTCVKDYFRNKTCIKAESDIYI